jgi:thiol-disulfide isomerase/thioredoxin
MGIRVWLGVVYTALAAFATPAAADPRLAALLEGDMRKLVLHGEPRAVAQEAFRDAAGGEHRLGDWRGRVVLVNFWATWCAPCRHEMPALDRLQAALGGERFTVLTIATGRNALPAIERFFAETGVKNLPVLLDPRSALARASGVVGLPATILIDAGGREIGRMLGEAAWDSPSAIALLRAVIGD